jgi:restriction system protein
VPKSRNDDMTSALFDLFMATPWWVCPVTAGICYAGLAYLIPAGCPATIIGKACSAFSRAFAPWLAFFVIVIGAAAAIRRWHSNRLLTSHQNLLAIRKLTWQQFEVLIAAAYRQQGYRVVETGGGGADGGVDLVLHGQGEKILVQCKHWRAYRVGVRELREFHGIISSRDMSAVRGFFVTSGTFTTEAQRFAAQNEIEVVDGEHLQALITKARQTAGSQQEATPIAPQALADAHNSQNTPPACPRCGQPMLLRKAHRGERSGSQFWGCSQFPTCRGTLNYEADSSMDSK